MVRRRIILPALLLLVSLPAPAPPASGEPRAFGGPGGYYRPVIVDGMTFPVARSGWLSVIEFEEDWHDPRFRLIDGRWQLVGYHEGVDIVAEEGTPILSASAGVVERVGWTFYSGTRVGVRGSDGRYYFYAHLSEVADDIREGVSVETGTALGRVGNTGYGPPGHRDEFPPHLHFGIQDGIAWVNPYPLVRRLYRRSAAVTGRALRRIERLETTGRDPGRVVDMLYGEPA